VRVKHLKQVLLASIAAGFLTAPAQAEPLEPTVVAEATKLINNIRNKLDSCGEEGMLSNQGTQRVALAVTKPRPMLAWSPRLATIAQQHAKAMAEQNFFDHIDPQGRSVGQRASESGYRWRVVGENLAAGHDSIGDAVRGWLLSTGHCKNLIDDRFTEFGIARVQSNNPLDPYGSYWVMVAGRPQTSDPAK
jgi:uncharacterized protein YkwD